MSAQKQFVVFPVHSVLLFCQFLLGTLLVLDLLYFPGDIYLVNVGFERSASYNLHKIRQDKNLFIRNFTVEFNIHSYTTSQTVPSIIIIKENVV